jgi:hypothetical protein
MEKCCNFAAKECRSLRLDSQGDIINNHKMRERLMRLSIICTTFASEFAIMAIDQEVIT